jgi:hypothetical protein
VIEQKSNQRCDAAKELTMFSFLKSLGNTFGSGRGKAAGRRRGPRPGVEQLEGRCLPTVSGLTGVQVFAQYYDNYRQKSFTTTTLSPTIDLGVETQLDAQYVASYQQSHGGQSPPPNSRDTSQDPFYGDPDLTTLLQSMVTETYQANTTGAGYTQIKSDMTNQIQSAVSKYGLSSYGVSLSLTQNGDYSAQLLPGSKLELVYTTHGNTVDFSVHTWLGDVSMHASFDVAATVDLQLPVKNVYTDYGNNLVPPSGIQVLSAKVKAANANVSVSGASNILTQFAQLVQAFDPNLVNQLASKSFNDYSMDFTGSVGSQLGNVNQMFVPFCDLDFTAVKYQVDPNDPSQLDMTFVETPSEQFYVHDLKAQENYPLQPDQVPLVATGAVVQVAPFVDDSNSSPTFNGNVQAWFDSGARYTDIQAEAWRDVKTETIRQTDANGLTQIINITPPLSNGEVYTADLTVDYAAGTVSGQFSVITGGGMWQPVVLHTESIYASTTQTQEWLSPDAQQLEKTLENFGVHLDYNSRDIPVHIPGMIATNPDLWFTLTLTGPVGGVAPSLPPQAFQSLLGQVAPNGAMAIRPAMLGQAAASESDLLAPLLQYLAATPQSAGAGPLTPLSPGQGVMYLRPSTSPDVSPNLALAGPSATGPLTRLALSSGAAAVATPPALTDALFAAGTSPGVAVNPQPLPPHEFLWL